MKRNLLFLLLVISSIKVSAQDQQQIDSLQSELKNHEAKKLELGKSTPAMYDTTAANILYELSKAHWYGQPDKAIVFANRSKALSESINYKKGLGFAIYSIGVSYTWKSEFPLALEYSNKALKLGEAMGNKQLIASAYTNLGVVNNFQSNYPEALKNFFSALTIGDAIGDKQILIWNYGNIANIYSILGNFEDALRSNLAGLKIAEQLSDKSAIAAFYNAIGYNYMKFGRYSESISYCLKSLNVSKDLNDKFQIANAYYNLGNTYQEQGNYTEALKYYFNNLRYVEELDDKAGMGYVYGSVGEVYYKQKKYLQAIKYLNKGLKIAKEVGNLDLMKYNYQNLSNVYYDMATSPLTPAPKKVDFALQAHEYYKHFITYRDSMVNIENTKKITQQQMQYEFDKKELATKADNEKKRALAAAEIQKHKLIRNFSFVGIFVVLLAGGYGFYRYRKNKELENHQSLLNERLRISRELHDDMGSTLSSISVYSEVAKNRAEKNENETEVLSKIGTASRELIEKMSDIVWSLNPNNENFEQLKNRMMAFAAMMLTPKGILFQFEIDDEIKRTSFAPEQRKNIFLIYKEAINNIVKYSEATSVKVKVKIKDNKLSLEVIDNGKGFDTNNVVAYNGNGLKNMRARAEEIKALFNVTSKINEGVKIELALSI